MVCFKIQALTENATKIVILSLSVQEKIIILVRISRKSLLVIFLLL